MLPEGAQSWNGGLNEELVVKFDKEEYTDINVHLTIY